MLPLKETKSGVTFPVQVVPRSSKCQMIGRVNDTLKVRLTAPPVDGKANEECLRYLSTLFNVSRNRLSIVSGQTSRRKVIQISGMDSGGLETLLERILPPNRAPELFDNLDEEGKSG